MLATVIFIMIIARDSSERLSVYNLLGDFHRDPYQWQLKGKVEGSL